MLDKDQTVRRPKIVEFYNKNKGGIDIFDQLCKNYSTARNTKRWPLIVFFGLLNAAGVNSFVLWKNNMNAEIEKKKTERRRKQPTSRLESKGSDKKIQF